MSSVIRSSRRACEIAVREGIASHTKKLAPPLYLAKDKKQAVHDYVLLQICQAFPCVNLCEDPSFEGAIFDPAEIPSDVHIFRRTDSFTQAYVSEEFVAAADTINPIGIDFHRLKSL